MKSLIREIRADVEAIARDRALYEDKNFRNRVDLLDFLEVDVLDRVESLLLADGQTEDLTGLKQFAETVKTSLEDVDERVFQRLRNDIASRNHTGAALKQQLIEYAGADTGKGDEGYDHLDAIVNGVLLVGAAPEETRVREPEMVFYQPTPARIVLELVEKGSFQPDDVFYDIGSGLGQVAILVHLLSGVRTKGVEFEPAFCDFAGRCARALNLPEVAFINADAREASYADGTVFFLYTPFEGGILEQVLGKLRDEPAARGIRVFTYGPCTPEVEQQRWLERVDHNGSKANGLAEFKTSERALRAA